MRRPRLKMASEEAKGLENSYCKAPSTPKRKLELEASSLPPPESQPLTVPAAPAKRLKRGEEPPPGMALGFSKEQARLALRMEWEKATVGAGGLRELCGGMSAKELPCARPSTRAAASRAKLMAASGSPPWPPVWR